MKQLTDFQLMDLVKEGDFSAFDELYCRYHGAVRKFLFSLTWDSDLADDYLQEVFVKLYQARDRYQPTGKFTSYLFRIAKNYYLAQRRKEKSRPETVQLLQENRNGARPIENLKANARIEPEVHLLESYRRWKIRQAIGNLPENQKLVFVMSHFENLKYEEIAEILGVPLGTVKSRMFYAVKSLKALLKEEQI